MSSAPDKMKQPKNNEQLADKERDDQIQREEIDPMDILPEDLHTDDLYRTIKSRSPSRNWNKPPSDKEQPS